MSTNPASSTLVCDVHAPTWLAPRPPQPTTATRTVSLGLFWPRTMPVAAAAALIKKYLRFIALLCRDDAWVATSIIQVANHVETGARPASQNLRHSRQLVGNIRRTQTSTFPFPLQDR